MFLSFWFFMTSSKLRGAISFLFFVFWFNIVQPQKEERSGLDQGWLKPIDAAKVVLETSRKGGTFGWLVFFEEPEPQRWISVLLIVSPNRKNDRAASKDNSEAGSHSLSLGTRSLRP